MNKLIRFVGAIAIASLVIFISGCNLSKLETISGEWTLSTINGVTPKVYYSASGYPLPENTLKIEISGEKMIMFGKGSSDDMVYDIKAVSDGYEVLKDGTVEGTLFYNKADDILALIPAINAAYSFEFKRGAYNYSE